MEIGKHGLTGKKEEVINYLVELKVNINLEKKNIKEPIRKKKNNKLFRWNI